MHGAELFAEHHHLLRRQWFEANDRSQQIPRTRPRKLALRQAGTKRLIAVDAAPLVLHSLRRGAHDDAEIPRLSLQRIVVHGQQLFIIVLPGDGVRNLIEIHELIDEEHHARIPGQPEKHGEELQIFIPVVVRDQDIDAQLFPGFPFERVFPAKPSRHPGLHLILTVHISMIID